MLKFMVVALLLVVSGFALAQTAEQDYLEVQGTGSYVTATEGSRQTAREVALFEAKLAAVIEAGNDLSHKGFIEPYQDRKNEIYSLTADRIHAEVVHESWEALDHSEKCIIRVQSVVHAYDFIKAEVLNKQLAKEDDAESFVEEMEPQIGSEVQPGRDISKGYRLLGGKKWRRAAIYFDRLQLKYPNWDSVYLAKAFVFHRLDENWHMETALRKACALGSARSCNELKKWLAGEAVTLDPEDLL